VDALTPSRSRGAVVLDGAPVPLSALGARVRRRAHRLVALHREGRARLAFVASPTEDALLTLLAALEAGLPVLPLHPRWSAAERLALMASLGASLVDEGVDEAEGPATLLEGAPRVEPAPRGAPAALGDIVLATSGSSGAPKGVRLPRASFLASARAHAANLPFEPDDRWLLAIPFAHAGGLSIITRCLALGSTFVLASGAQDAESILASIERDRITLLSVVPTQLARLLAADRHGVLRRLRAILVGGAAFSTELRREATGRGIATLATYGLTETASQIATERPRESGRDARDSGRPLDTVHLQILDEGGRPREPGEVGRIVVSGPMLFAGYVGGAPRSDGEPFDTGDLGLLEEDGRLVVLGRRDDTIVTGGENVHPSELEAVLRTVPDVGDAVVFGVPDPLWGEVVAAAIVARSSPTLLATLRRINDGLAPFRRVRRVAFVDEVPVDASGKVSRRTLRERLAGALVPL
jgi:o-succinylbenzoate---CoA ligase